MPTQKQIDTLLDEVLRLKASVHVAKEMAAEAPTAVSDALVAVSVSEHHVDPEDAWVLADEVRRLRAILSTLHVSKEKP